jgi:hypothetical protein
MRKLTWLVRIWGAACLVMMVGCVSPKPNLKPPKQPEKFNVPSDTDARYSETVKYPEGTPRAAKVKHEQMMNAQYNQITPGPTNPNMYTGQSLQNTSAAQRPY